MKFEKRNFMGIDLERAVMCGSPDGLCGSIDWVICGGESGPGHRDMDPAWAMDLRNQCLVAGVPFHFKQHAGPRPGWKPELDGEVFRWVPPLSGET